jgi:phosphoglycolate phosphatase-like HAD superfamily hydrolase
MEKALAEVCRIEKINGDVLAAGRTDRAITADLFALHNVEETPELWAEFQATYFKHLPATLAELQGTVLPGIAELLSRLAERPDEIALGLLTGNFREGAALKLRNYVIDHHFLFVGYGDEHHERDDVARVALEQAVRHLQREVDAETVWVIGDTPSDVRCARAIGANAVAVATGIDPEPLLERVFASVR